MNIEEIEAKYLNLLCERILKSPLVESDSHDDPEDENWPKAMMTQDQAFYFVPDYTNPLMSRRRLTLGGNIVETPIPNKFHYSIEVVKCFPGGHWEPDDYDLVSIEDGLESIEKAIGAAAHHLLDLNINGIGEELFWMKESELAPLIEEYMKNNK